MKKSILFALGLLVCIGCMAADKITVAPVTVQQGGTGVLSINLSNPDTEFAAFQFRLTTAEGISIAKDGDNLLVEKGERLATDNAFENFNITTSAVSTTVYDFLAYQLQTAAFPGTDGTIVKITLADDGSHDVGTTLQCTLSNIEVSDPESNSYDLENVTFTVTIGEPDDGRIHFDENATKLPTYTAGEKGNVTLKRTIKANQWSTLVLPFTLTKANATDVFGSDVEFAKFDGFVVDYGDDEENITPLGITINFTEYTIPARGGKLVGGTPVLIKTTKDIEEINFDDVTLTEIVTGESKDDEYGTPGKFTGSLVKTTVPADGLFIADNKFWYSTGATNIKAFRGWFELDAVLDKETTNWGVKLNFVLDNNPTAIDSIDGELRNGQIYDLGGRKISKPTQKGIFIVNGKKVAVK